MPLCTCPQLSFLLSAFTTFFLRRLAAFIGISGRYLIIPNPFFSGLITLIQYFDDYFDVFCLSELSLCLSHLIIVCPNRFILCLVSIYSYPLP